LSRIPDRKGTVHSVDAYRDALETARRRQPNLILIEIDRATAEITTLSRDCRGSFPMPPLQRRSYRIAWSTVKSEGATVIELLRAHVRDFLRRPLAATNCAASSIGSSRAVPPAPARTGEWPRSSSNKGGIGKSTLAVNVACGLALRHPDEVLLIDTSLQIGTCAMMLDLQADARALSTRSVNAIASTRRSCVTSPYGTEAGCGCSRRQPMRSRQAKSTTKRLPGS
jgi:pilus assembly protein CpaE